MGTDSVARVNSEVAVGSDVAADPELAVDSDVAMMKKSPGLAVDCDVDPELIAAEFAHFKAPLETVATAERGTVPTIKIAATNAVALFLLHILIQNPLIAGSWLTVPPLLGSHLRGQSLCWSLYGG